MSQIQNIVDLSTVEAEYVAVIEANKEFIWLQGLLTVSGFIQEKCALYSDSQSVIHLAKNSTFIREQNTLVFVITSLDLLLRMRC